MSVAVSCKDCSGFKAFPVNVGFSREYENLKNYFQNVIKHTYEPVSIGCPLEEVLESLRELYEDCSVENWDAYGALRIDEDAYYEAWELIQVLPSSIPMPEVSAHPDGGIGFEWYRGYGFSFVISVSGKNVLSYAGVFGGNTIHGTECFRESISSNIVEYLQRLYPEGETYWNE